MTTITPELQALADAALQVSDHIDARRTECIGESEQHLSSAAATYRASIAPKECRPPADAKDGSLWWLTRNDAQQVGRWRDFLGNKNWQIHNGDISVRTLTEAGWTVHSECVFPGERVEVTDVAFPRLGEIMELAVKYHYVAGVPWEPIQVQEFLREALLRFVPKLRSISDEKIVELWAQHVDSGSKLQNFNVFKAIRAVETYIKGERE